MIIDGLEIHGPIFIGKDSNSELAPKHSSKLRVGQSTLLFQRCAGLFSCRSGLGGTGIWFDWYPHMSQANAPELCFEYLIRIVEYSSSLCSTCEPNRPLCSTCEPHRRVQSHHWSVWIQIHWAKKSDEMGETMAVLPLQSSLEWVWIVQLWKGMDRQPYHQIEITASLPTGLIKNRDSFPKTNDMATRCFTSSHTGNYFEAVIMYPEYPRNNLHNWPP